MQIDGRRSVPLYRDGQIVKDLNRPGIQHPIPLVVNFHLPCAVVFKFEKSFILSLLQNDQLQILSFRPEGEISSS